MVVMARDFLRLERELGRQELREAYLLCGEDPYLLQRAERMIIEAVLSPAERGFNLTVFSGKEAAVKEVVEAARTLPFMASRRVVVLRDAEEVFKRPPAVLTDYLNRPTPSTVLLMVAKKRIAPPPEVSEGFYDLTPSRREVSLWLKRLARERGIALTPAALSLLRELVGDDLTALSLEVEKLALYKGKGTVDEEDVQEVVADIRVRSVFEMVEAMEHGDLDRAISVLERIWRHGDPSPKILGAIAWRIRDRLKKGGDGRLVRALRRLQALDLEVKRRGTAAKLLLAEMILELVC
ncbi:MAG: DNA polymerase III subunit delta [Deltaproteobacteria bacterium]|nr:MAG: DNA polymerase III subunit delta [Deltaproteobacteria bacterium]